MNAACDDAAWHAARLTCPHLPGNGWRQAANQRSDAVRRKRLANASRVVRFVLEFGQALELRERAAPSARVQDPHIGRALSGQFANPVERGGSAFGGLDEFLNGCAGNDLKTHGGGSLSRKRRRVSIDHWAADRWGTEMKL